MALISLVTPVLAGKHQWLPELYESIGAQELPPGWDWEWIVQEDGETGAPASVLNLDDPRVHFDAAARGRAATARTLAIGRAEGELCRPVDADDLLTPGALAAAITALTTAPVGWCVAPAVDLLPDGSTRRGPRDPEPGILPDRTMYDGERDGLLPVLGCTMTAYTDLIRAVGGWQALPVDEDVALLLALEAVSDGYMLADPGLYYRRWTEQTTAGRDAAQAAPPSLRRDIILGRVDAMHRQGWRWEPPPR